MMKKFILFICLFFTYQCEDVLPFLQEDEVNPEVDLSISFISSEPTYLMPESDLIVNYSISNPSDNEIPSKLLWVDLFYDSSGTYVYMPTGFYSYIYNS